MASTHRGFTPPWLPYVFILLDFLLLSFATTAPNPLWEDSWPVQMQFRNDTIVYYFIFFAIVAFSYSRWHMLWAGVAAAAAMSGGVLWLLSLPDTLTSFGHFSGLAVDQELAAHLDSRFVDANVWIQNVVLLLLVAWALATVVARSRRLVVSQVVAARERANLARYFPPTVVDELAELDQPLGAVRQQPVAVLFADIVGFSRLAEGTNRSASSSCSGRSTRAWNSRCSITAARSTSFSATA